MCPKQILKCKVTKKTPQSIPVLYILDLIFDFAVVTLSLKILSRLYFGNRRV